MIVHKFDLVIFNMNQQFKNLSSKYSTELF